jgi:hypothetical protein
VRKLEIPRVRRRGIREDNIKKDHKEYVYKLDDHRICGSSLTETSLCGA